MAADGVEQPLFYSYPSIDAEWLAYNNSDGYRDEQHAFYMGAFAMLNFWLGHKRGDLTRDDLLEIVNELQIHLLSHRRICPICQKGGPYPSIVGKWSSAF
ncbi:MAG: hypothetical protein C5B60_08495 [Chloroflexi bacterium]|nr:MAG: hypothetical protein C5B60_08495 [Chloroflexota bacterium]